MTDFCGRVTAAGGMISQLAASSVTEYLGCQVLMQGYIADRADLIRQLGLDALSLRSDGELIVHGFRKWGCELQARVLGEYAAVVFDRQQKTALLTHDALGLVSLFYVLGPESIAFSSSLVELIDAARCQTIDGEYLADFLVNGCMTSERTPYPSIRRLVPGRSLWWSGGKTREIETWSLADNRPVTCRDDREYEEIFRALLKAGVTASIGRTGTTWIALSGGLDSSSVACMASDIGAGGLAAYSIISPKWPEADEQDWMRAVIDRCGMPWHTIDIDTMLPFSRLPIGFDGEPTHTAINEEQLRIENELLGANGVSTMLTGHGGDTVLCGSPGSLPSHLADPVFALKFDIAFRGMANWRNGRSDRRSYSYWILRTLVGPTLDHLLGRRAHVPLSRNRLPPWINRDYANEMRLARRARTRLAPPCREPGRQTFAEAVWAQAMSMAVVPRHRMGFELRNPLMYRPLVEFMSGIPWDQKLRPRSDRYLQRRALKGVLPEKIRRRATKGNGNPPLVEGLRQSKDWVAYLCDNPLMAERGIVDASEWRKSVQLATVGRTHDDMLFLTAVAIEAWLKQLNEHRRQASARLRQFGPQQRHGASPGSV